MNEHKELAITALEQMKGDDTLRARFAFCGLDEDGMKRAYGVDGITPAEILKNYEERDAKIDAAIEWVKKQQ